MVEDAAKVVGNVAHHEAVEQRHAPVRAGAGQDTAGGQEAEILQSLVKWLLPAGWLDFTGSERPRDPAPGILDGQIDRRAVGCLQPVFRIPDLAGNWRDPLDGRPDHRIDIHIKGITISLASLALLQRFSDRGKDVAAMATAERAACSYAGRDARAIGVSP